MTNAPDFSALVNAVRGPSTLRHLLGPLGFEPCSDRIHPGGWSAYGLADAPSLRALLVPGRAGTLHALLMELTVDPDPQQAAALARRVRARNPARLDFFIFTSRAYERLLIGLFGVDEGFRHLTLERGALRPSDLDALAEMVPGSGETGLELALRHTRALDRSRLARRFFLDFRARRDAISAAWTGVPADAGRERGQLALLLLSRLTFLYFLQKRGALGGHDRYLVQLFGEWSASLIRGRQGSFYRRRLHPLFFEALNRRPEDRSGDARRLGDLPYLNGGLFEPHSVERRFPDMDLPDRDVRACFDDLLERYRFTTREGGDAAGHRIDPEVLGQVFEGLMSPQERGDTGSFYTPMPVVQRVVKEALVTYMRDACGPDAAVRVTEGRGGELDPSSRYRVRRKLERVRVLDPSCGSGAFLLGALERLATALHGVGDAPYGAVRREIAARSLHGVDLLDDAALLCSLRLWLALSADDGEVRPLPNLDRRIRQGDALVDPLDLGELQFSGEDGEPAWQPLRDPDIRRALRSVGPAALRYLESAPSERSALKRELDLSEARLARRWVDGARRSCHRQVTGLRARAGQKDLFGEVPETALRAARAAARAEERLAELEAVAAALDEKGALPFFSFGVHFAEAAGGFDLVISNPPWVRAHRWPDRLRRLCERFEVCRQPAWREAATLTGAPLGAGAQVDLSLLFVERAIRLLAPGGVLAVLLPAKAMRALYGGAARRMLLRDLELTLVEDHSLDQRSIFRADAFAVVLVGRRRVQSQATGAAADPVTVRQIRRGTAPLEYELRQRDLPLFRADTASPWLLAPPAVAAALRTMQAAGPPVGRHADIQVRRGVMTGANDVLLLGSAEAKLGGLAIIEAEGLRRARREGKGRAARSYRAVVESGCIRPLVRGADIDAFRYGTSSYTVWCHDARGAPVAGPPRLSRYLERHRSRLEGRSGWRPGMPLGALFRLTAETLGHKVAWHDLSDTLRAVALPPLVAWAGSDRELVPLNTVYFIPTRDARSALLLGGLLNTLPARVFTRGIAERAKDGRFRFFAWTVSTLPLPVGWADHPAAAEILALSERAHEAGGISAAERGRLDGAAGRLYGLDTAELEAMESYDRWLGGGP